MVKKVHHPKKDWLLLRWTHTISSSPVFHPSLLSRPASNWCCVRSPVGGSYFSKYNRTVAPGVSTLVQSLRWHFSKLIQQFAVFSHCKLSTNRALMMHVGWWVRKQIWGFMPNSYVWCCFDMIISEYISVQNKANNSMHLIDSIHGAPKLCLIEKTLLLSEYHHLINLSYHALPIFLRLMQPIETWPATPVPDKRNTIRELSSKMKRKPCFLETLPSTGSVYSNMSLVGVAHSDLMSIWIQPLYLVIR